MKTISKIEIETTKGTAKPHLPYAKKIITCGINMLSELQIQVYTDENERAGYACYYNLKTHKARYARIQVIYVSEETRRKYGRGVGYETLPILITKKLY